jgi:hypothetical protein
MILIGYLVALGFYWLLVEVFVEVGLPVAKSFLIG